MNISEFERTKPVETMKALNALIKKVRELVDDSTDINVDSELFDIWERLKSIKEKFKKGE